MQLSLLKCGELKKVVLPDVNPNDQDDRTLLDVSYCAICRTDAKMWHEGHRDLVLPRVPGHEFVGRDRRTGKLFVSWPGQACLSCVYCKSGRENLCENMRILGFHDDGGYSTQVLVPKHSLIPVQDGLDEKLLTFAEPIGCVLNGFEHLKPHGGEHLLIYGGGVVGALAALVARSLDCHVTIIEQSAEKIEKIREFCKGIGVNLAKETSKADYDCAINCCDSHIAFAQTLTRVRKGGRINFFSGLKKREELETGLLNLIHYKELELTGSYGPRREHMEQAVTFIRTWQDTLPLLVEEVISPDQVENAFKRVLRSETLKYIIDFKQPDCPSPDNHKRQVQVHKSHQPLTIPSGYLQDLIKSIQPVNSSFEPTARRKMDLKTKPLGALGKLEHLGVQLSVIQNSLMPEVTSKRLFVFAGDHGVVDEGVSAFPSKVTIQMVENFLEGGAAINVFCRQYDIDLKIVDMGVNNTFAPHPLLIDKKIAKGTNNFALTSAMTPEQALLALEKGAKTFIEQQQSSPCKLIGMGEMGIGNTTSATAVICAATGVDIDQVIGRGTGVDDEGLKRKRDVVRRSLALHDPNPENGLEILTTLGGYELGGIAGAVLAAAANGCCVVLDGVISTAAGLIAYLLCPDIAGYLVAGHNSVEKAQQAALEKMDLGGVIDLNFRLGEGTGAAVTMNLVDLACRTMREMASFEEAGIDSGDI